MLMYVLCQVLSCGLKHPSFFLSFTFQYGTPDEQPFRPELPGDGQCVPRLLGKPRHSAARISRTECAQLRCHLHLNRTTATAKDSEQ